MTDTARLLFVDDDPRAGELLLRFSHDSPFSCRVYQDPEQMLADFREQGADIIISDLRMPGMDGINLLKAVREIDNIVPFIIITAYSSVEDAIRALRLGATDFIKKPYDADELLLQAANSLDHSRLRLENKLLKRQLHDEQARYEMLGQSAVMQTIYAQIDKLANIRCNVIIEGESGTGKELVARAIHQSAQNRNSPFIVIDCGALSDTLLESELFGHEKGAFTGAISTKPGLLETASGGTVFLDEICNISDNMQTKLLRVVQEQQITHVGGVKPVTIDVRFVVASNRVLDQMVKQGHFREDLYHRLNVIKIRVPPLRERREDIPALVQSFISELSLKYNRRIDSFSPESLQQLAHYSWPGNVRELRNLVERGIALAEGPVLDLAALHEPGIPIRDESTIDSDMPSIEELEKRYILKVLEQHQGNRELSAATLGINKSTLWRKLQQYNK
ncbi:MAG TPA: sigma-54-dependent Fis family transcriptional regulator [Gammaproteobacteria bacterium]|nr:sigma-54-dependent Fis family transcriptional regulator [Gammaproteobacteria bacterium]